jgi:hypothetical protein
LIAMLDVLGFSSKTNNRKGAIEVLDTYTNMIAHARDRIFIARSSDEVNRNLDFHKFASVEFAFDTLVLVSLPLNAVNVGAFINTTCHLMSYFAVNDMPLRGAIGIGDYASDEKGSDSKISVTTISKILHCAEVQQQWSGCYIIKECESRIVAYLSDGSVPDSPSQSSALYRYHVPLKDDKYVDAYCLNWAVGMSEEDNLNLLHYMNNDPQKKANTAEFLTYSKNLPRTEYTLPPNFLPAVTATVVRCGPGIQIYLWDKDGRGATSMGCKHIFFDPKQPHTNAFQGYD